MDRHVEKEAFIIDTDSYAGNFEREMFAYITGQEYEYETGFARPLREEAVEELPPDVMKWFEDNIVPIMNDKGAYAPMDIHPTPGFFNNGVGGHFRPGQEEEAIAHRRAHYLEDSKKAPYRDDAHNEEYRQQCIERAEKPLEKFDAYQSVAIYMVEKPPEHILNVIKERAQVFCELKSGQKDLGHTGGPIELLGFRWGTFYTSSEAVPI